MYTNVYTCEKLYTKLILALGPRKKDAHTSFMFCAWWKFQWMNIISSENFVVHVVS